MFNLVKSHLKEKLGTLYSNLSEDQLNNITKIVIYSQKSRVLTDDELLSQGISRLAFTNTNSVAKKIFVPYKVQGSKVVPLLEQNKINNYMKGISALDNYFSNNPLPSGLDLDKIDWYILDTSDKFAKFYKALGTTRSEKYIRENVAGFNSVNLGTGKTTIGFNPELQSGKGGESNFGTEDRYAETAIHEFAHSLHRAISLDFGKKDALSKREQFNQDYAEIAKQDVGWYGKQDYMEHFSEAFSKYLSTGEATPEFKQFLQKYIHNTNKSLPEGAKDGRAGEPGEQPGIGSEGQRIVPEGVGPQGRPDDGRTNSVSDSPWSSLGDPLTPSDRVKELANRGKNTPELYEIDAEKDAPAFRAAMQKLKENNPYAASVYIYEEDEYRQMRLFATADGKAGFALKNGNEIVSVYVYSNSEHRGASRSLIAQAVSLGGDRLDAFDTALPHIYAVEGFRPISRVSWNDEYAPEGWDKQLYQNFNNGRPDVVVMAYDPEKVDQDYVPGEGEYFQDYDAALEARDKWIDLTLKKSPEPTPENLANSKKIASNISFDDNKFYSVNISPAIFSDMKERSDLLLEDGFIYKPGKYIVSGERANGLLSQLNFYIDDNGGGSWGPEFAGLRRAASAAIASFNESSKNPTNFTTEKAPAKRKSDRIKELRTEISDLDFDGSIKKLQNRNQAEEKATEDFKEFKSQFDKLADSDNSPSAKRLRRIIEETEEGYITRKLSEYDEYQQLTKELSELTGNSSTSESNSSLVSNESSKSNEDYVDAELTDLPRLDPDYTSDERNALRTYTSVENGRHTEINTYLRTGEWVGWAANDEKEQQRLLGVIEKLKNMINETSLPQNTKLVRYQRNLPPGMDQVGAVWTSDGFLSTAAITADGLPVTNSFTGLPFEIEIKAPKGSKAGAIIGSFEGEVLLPPGSKFLVESVEKQGLKSVKIGLKLIEQNDSQPINSSRIVEPGFENWIPEVFNIFESIDLEEDQLGDRGNKIQLQFLEKAGFNGKPTVVSQEEFDAAEGEAIYRAVRSEDLVDDFINSPTQYAGEGSFGNGTYTTNKRESTEYYAGDTGGDRDIINARTMEMKLAPDANVLSFEEVTEMRDWANKKGNEFLSRYIKAGANPAQAQEIDWQMNNDSDWTNLAIMNGIDAVRFKVPMTRDDEYYTIILNRGKVIVNGKS